MFSSKFDFFFRYPPAKTYHFQCLVAYFLKMLYHVIGWLKHEQNRPATLIMFQNLSCIQLASCTLLFVKTTAH